MHKRLAPKLILSLTIIVTIVATISGVIAVKKQERQLLDAMIMGADQLSRGIVSATWHSMMERHRESAYEVMHTIALKQGMNRIRIFNKEGQVTFSTNPEDRNKMVDKRTEACAVCHGSQEPLVRVSMASRARVFVGDDGRRKLGMVSPIYNEPVCSRAPCHAHPEPVKVLGVLDLTFNLDSVDRQIASAQRDQFLTTGIQVVLISAFIIFFTRRFVDLPVRKLMAGAKAVSAMELDKPIDIIESSEEFNELARSFDTMRERLRLAVGEINEFTASLESKVEQRTEQLKTAQQKLMQADRLASLGQLAATVAHEINNPVSGVLNLSMLMQRILTDDGIPPGRIADFRKYLTQVTNETSRVGRIVSDLLAFSRRSKPQRTQADLNRIVRTTLSLVSHKLKLTNVELEVELDEKLPPLLCDPSQIQQVVLNLVMNGAEATSTKEVRKLWISTRQDNGSAVMLSVRDTGEGIAPENVSKIFDPFFTTKGGKGVGLGLAVLYGIVHEHGGDVEVQSKVGEGATFTVRLPLAAAAPATAA